MGTRLNWERLNMREKIRDRGSVDGRFAPEMRRIERITKSTKKRRLTDAEKRSLYYVLTGERI
ncbi:MAG: hypothetical protein JRE23_08765 [Deltaproteobacteria bacterium]|nr:hypothetical protein [Deltaproteobacteria bacterium]